MIDEADRNGDGEIDEEEFVRIMKKTNLFWGDRKERGSLNFKYFPWIHNERLFLLTYTYMHYLSLFAFDFIINTFNTNSIFVQCYWYSFNQPQNREIIDIIILKYPCNCQTNKPRVWQNTIEQIWIFILLIYLLLLITFFTHISI